MKRAVLSLTVLLTTTAPYSLGMDLNRQFLAAVESNNIHIKSINYSNKVLVLIFKKMVQHHYTMLLAKILLKYGANPNIQDFMGYTPLHNAAANYKLDLIKLLLAQGANSNAVNISGRTPLEHVIYNTIDIVNFDQAQHIMDTIKLLLTHKNRS